MLRAKRLSNLVQAWNPGLERDAQRQQIMDSLLKAETADSLWRAQVAGLVTRQQVVELSARAAAEVATERVWVRSHRRQRWFEWCNDQMENGSRQLFKWVREGSRAISAPLWTAPEGGRPARSRGTFKSHQEGLGSPSGP